MNRTKNRRKIWTLIQHSLGQELQNSTEIRAEKLIPINTHSYMKKSEITDPNKI